MRQDIKAMQLFIDEMTHRPKFSYPADKNVPRPANEFASVKLIEQYVVGLPVRSSSVEVKDNAGNVTGSRNRVSAAAYLRFRIQVVDTLGIASIQIANGWTTSAMRELMIKTGYGYISCKPIGLEDALLEKDWEAREGFSVVLSVTRVHFEELDNIGNIIDISATYYKGLETILMDIDINEP